METKLSVYSNFLMSKVSFEFLLFFLFPFNFPPSFLIKHIHQRKKKEIKARYVKHLLTNVLKSDRRSNQRDLLVMVQLVHSVQAIQLEAIGDSILSNPILVWSTICEPIDFEPIPGQDSS